MADISSINLPNGSSYNIKDANVPHSSLPASSSGTDLSLVTTGEKYQWENSTLAGLSDVDIDTTTLTGGGILVYDSVNDKWINTEESLYISDTQVRVSDASSTNVKDTRLTKSGISHITSGSFKSYFGTSGTTRGILLQNSSSKDRLKISYTPTMDYVYEIFYTEGGLEGTTITPYEISNTSGSFSSVSTQTLNGVTVGNNPEFTDTTYTFANGTNGFTVTPSGGTAQTVTVTPSITNNVTGSGTSGYIAKFNGANTITNAVALGSDTTKYLRNDGTWVKPPDNNTTYTLGTSSNNVTLTPSSGSVQSITVPYSTLSNTVNGVYTANGGQQGPDYFGKNRAGFLMSNATVAGDTHFKNWLYMDNYNGTDVGGATAFGIDRTEPRAFIMQSDANRTSWNNTAALGVFTATPTSGQVVTTDGTTGGIKSSGYTIAKSVPSNAVFTDTNTTYSLTQDSTDGHKITLTPSSGTAQTITIPDNNTTYSAGTGITISGNNNAINVSYGTTATTACVGNDSRLSNARTPTSHIHGNIQNGGTLQTNDITIASGDKIIVTDSSDSSKIARTSIAFDGSTATKALTQKGTWETFGTSNLTIGTTSTTALKGDTKYAGASTAGGSATSAAKLDTATAGSATQPCYFANGVPSACTYSLNKTVPSNAVFTDTNNAVTQTATPSTNSDYEVLFSGTADNTTRTEGVRKNTNLTFNPLNGILTTGNVKADSYNALDSNGVNRLESYVDSSGAGRTNWYENTGYGTVTISGAVGDNIWLSDGTDTTTVCLNGETGKITCNSMNVENISSSYSTSKSSGALGAATVTAYRTGNVVQMDISFAKSSTSSQSVGSNIWVGTISGGPLPVNTISLMGYYSSAILQCQITSAGAVNMRIQGSAAQFTSACSVHGTFITP